MSTIVRESQGKQLADQLRIRGWRRNGKGKWKHPRMGDRTFGILEAARRTVVRDPDPRLLRNDRDGVVYRRPRKQDNLFDKKWANQVVRAKARLAKISAWERKNGWRTKYRLRKGGRYVRIG